MRGGREQTRALQLVLAPVGLARSVSSGRTTNVSRTAVVDAKFYSFFSVSGIIFARTAPTSNHPSKASISIIYVENSPRRDRSW